MQEFGQIKDPFLDTTAIGNVKLSKVISKIALNGKAAVDVFFNEIENNDSIKKLFEKIRTLSFEPIKEAKDSTYRIREAYFELLAINQF